MTISTRRRPVDVTKDPDADLDYGFKWHKWLQTGETITTSVWDISPSGSLATDANSISTDGDITTIWLQGGVAGQNYVVRNRVTTSLTRIDDRSMKVHVLER